MKKLRSKNAAKRAIILVLSASLIMGGLTSTAFAGVRLNSEAGEENQETESTESVSAPQLSCKTPVVEVPNDGSSVSLELWLTLPEELIKKRIYRRDVTLGGAFNGMIVSSLKHDRKTMNATFSVDTEKSHRIGDNAARRLPNVAVQTRPRTASRDAESFDPLIVAKTYSVGKQRTNEKAAMPTIFAASSAATFRSTNDPTANPNSAHPTTVTNERNAASRQYCALPSAKPMTSLGARSSSPRPGVFSLLILLLLR